MPARIKQHGGSKTHTAQHRQQQKQQQHTQSHGLPVQHHRPGQRTAAVTTAGAGTAHTAVHANRTTPAAVGTVSSRSTAFTKFMKHSAPLRKWLTCYIMMVLTEWLQFRSQPRVVFLADWGYVLLLLLGTYMCCSMLTAVLVKWLLLLKVRRVRSQQQQQEQEHPEEQHMPRQSQDNVDEGEAFVCTPLHRVVIDLVACIIFWRYIVLLVINSAQTSCSERCMFQLKTQVATHMQLGDQPRFAQGTDWFYSRGRRPVYTGCDYCISNLQAYLSWQHGYLVRYIQIILWKTLPVFCTLSWLLKPELLMVHRVAMGSPANSTFSALLESLGFSKNVILYVAPRLCTLHNVLSFAATVFCAFSFKSVITLHAPLRAYFIRAKTLSRLIARAWPLTTCAALLAALLVLQCAPWLVDYISDVCGLLLSVYAAMRCQTAHRVSAAVAALQRGWAGMSRTISNATAGVLQKAQNAADEVMCDIKCVLLVLKSNPCLAFMAVLDLVVATSVVVCPRTTVRIVRWVLQWGQVMLLQLAVCACGLLLCMHAKTRRVVYGFSLGYLWHHQQQPRAQATVPGIGGPVQHVSSRSTGGSNSSGGGGCSSACAPTAQQAGPAHCHEEHNACVVCFDVPRSVALMPCGHVVLCGGCFASLQKQARHAACGGLPCCPVCRTEVKRHVAGLIVS